MSNKYTPQIISPKNKSVQVKYPNVIEDVDLYVYRTNVFGSKALGDRGLYHSGLLFESGSKSWVIDLSIYKDMGTLIPNIINDTVVPNNINVLEYYSPEDKSKWSSYWNIKSEKICTISPKIYIKLLSYILDDFAKIYKYYVLLSISNKPLYIIKNNKGTTVSIEYTDDNTCDKLPMRCFEWLNKKYNISIKPFPITRLVMGIDSLPVKITNMKDPGLLSYVMSLHKYIDIMEAINKKDYSTVFTILQRLNDNKFNILEYTQSIDPDTKEQFFYKLPSTDVSLSAIDLYYKIDNKSMNYLLITILILVILIIIMTILFVTLK
jgi:hypothetical protein